MYYGPVIFQAVGFDTASAQVLATFGIGVVNLLMTVVALLLVDRIGRRSLMLLGTAIAALSLGGVGCIFAYHLETTFAHWAALLCMVTYIGGFALSLGSLFWLIIAEIYPLHIRGLAMSFVTAVQWGANFVVSISFLTVLQGIGPAGTFWLYGFMCVLAYWFSYWLLPETKGVSARGVASATYRLVLYRLGSQADGKYPIEADDQCHKDMA